MEEFQNSIFEYHDLIEAIVAALEMRDYHTQHHSRRVSNMVACLCRCLSLSEEDTRLYHIAADLHDIGKIGVRDSVLLKEGALTSEEWEEMKSHTIIGCYILGKVERFDEIAQIVRHHHERWDGNGYPDKLAEQEIPLGSRLIAVADSIDAMLSDRSYRKAMSAENCFCEIQKNIGVMYDTDIASAALSNWAAVLDARQSETTIRY